MKYFKEWLIYLRYNLQQQCIGCYSYYNGLDNHWKAIGPIDFGGTFSVDVIPNWIDRSAKL